MKTAEQYTTQARLEADQEPGGFIDSLAQDIEAIHGQSYEDTPRKYILGLSEDESMDFKTLAIALETKPEALMQLALRQFADRIYGDGQSFEEIKSRLEAQEVYAAKALKDRLLGLEALAQAED